MKTVSVVLAAYNGAEYLPEQLDSLAAQSRRPDELILVDDASGDETCNVAEQWLTAHDLPYKLLRNEKNAGSLRSFEKACCAASRDYIAFCDQDDHWDADKLEQMLKAMQKMEKKDRDVPCLVFSDARVTDAQGNLLSPSFHRLQRLHPATVSRSLYRLCVQNVVVGMAMMVNRKLLETALPFPDSAITHDWWTVLVCTATGGNIRYIPRPTCDYRQHETNVFGAVLYNDVNWWNVCRELKRNGGDAKKYFFEGLHHEVYDVYRPHLTLRGRQIDALADRVPFASHRLRPLAEQLKRGGKQATLWCVLHGALPPSWQRKVFFCRALQKKRRCERLNRE